MLCNIAHFIKACGSPCTLNMSPFDQHTVKNLHQQLHKALLARMGQKEYEGSKNSAEPCFSPWTPCLHMSSTFEARSQQQLHTAMFVSMQHKAWECF